MINEEVRLLASDSEYDEINFAQTMLCVIHNKHMHIVEGRDFDDWDNVKFPVFWGDVITKLEALLAEVPPSALREWANEEINE